MPAGEVAGWVVWEKAEEEIRNTKLEIRNKFEARNPKKERRGFIWFDCSLVTGKWGVVHNREADKV